VKLTEQDIQGIYDELAQQFELPSVGVFFDRTLCTGGVTHIIGGGADRIEISPWMGLADTIDVVRHEAAHVAAGGADRGHGQTFQVWARRFGCKLIGPCSAPITPQLAALRKSRQASRLRRKAK
jgi:hypothetical protein